MESSMPRREDLSPVRLVSEFNGIVKVDENGINRISNLLESTNSDGVIILSVVGPRGSGKSFFLNLMLKYLKSGGKGDWWNDLSKKNEPLKGFATRDTKNSSPTDLNGIYFWPEMVTVTASKNLPLESSERSEDQPTKDDEVKKYPVILLDSFFEDQKNELRSPAVDMFLCMVSSKVIINSVKSFKPEDLQSVMNLKADQISHCNQVTFLVRDSEASPYGHSKAMSHITDVLQKASGDVPDFAKMIDEMELTEACLMKQPNKIPLCDPSGHLKHADAAFVRSFKTFMNTLLDSDSLIKGARKIPDFKEFIRQNVCCASDLHIRLKCEELEEKGSSNTSSDGQGVCIGHADEVKVTEQIEKDNKQAPPPLLETENHSISMANSQVKNEQVLHSSTAQGSGKMLSMKDGELQNIPNCTEQKNQYLNPTTLGIPDEDVEMQTMEQDTHSDPHKMRSPKPLEKTRIQEFEAQVNDSNTKKCIVRIFPAHLDIPNRSYETGIETKKTGGVSAYFPPKQVSSPKEMQKANSTPLSCPGSSSGMAIRTSSSDSQSKLPSSSQCSAGFNIIPNSSQLVSKAEKQSNKPPSTDSLKLCEAQITKISEAHGIALKKASTEDKLDLLDALEMSGIHQHTERKSVTYGEKSHSSCDKQLWDELIQKEVSHLKAEFDKDLKTCPQKFQNQLVANYGDNFKQFLAVKLELPTAKAQASVTMLTNSLNVAIKKHLHAEVTSSRNPQRSQLQETSEQSKEDDKMDCSPPPPNPEEHEKPTEKINEEDASEPMETDQATEVSENPEVAELLSNFCKELYDFSNTVNIYRPSSYLLVEKKIEELIPLYFQEIEDKILQGHHPNSPLLSKINDSIKQINYDLASEFHSAQKDYESCLKSLNWKLEDATGKMTAAIINGDRTPNPASVFSNAFKLYTQTLQQKPKKLIQKMLKEDTQEFSCAMTYLEESLILYRRQMVKHLEMYKCMSHNVFDNFHQQFHKEAQAKLKSDLPFMSSQLANGIRRMCESFTKINQDVMRKEDENASHIARNDPKIKNFYNDMMKELTKATLWTPSQLQQLHDDVVREVTEAFKLACNFHQNSGLDFSNYSKMIKIHLQPLFSSYQQQNKLKGDALLISVKTAIDNQRKSYNYKMEECLKKAGGVMDAQQLKKHHNSTSTDVCTTLRFELEKMEGLGNLSSHIDTLQNKIESDWLEFKQENEKKAKLQETKERELQRNKKAEEAVLKETALEEERQQRLRASTSTTSTDSTKLPSASTLRTPAVKSSSTENKPQNLKTQFPVSTNVQPIPAKVLKPIAIEFGFHFIRVGWVNPTSHRFEIFQNAWGEDATPSVVALTNDGEVLVGSEATNRPQKDVKWKYSMTKLILETERPDIKFNFDQKLEDQRKELFMALLLSKVKDGVEQKLNGKWETVVLTVPLWYTSVHRQATRDAATIAGFKHVHLVNETSAAAMSYAYRSKDSSDTGMILVGVCNDSYFDVAVYNIKEGQLRMESSCGDQHSSVLQQNSVYSRVKQLFSDGKNFVLRREEKSETERKIKEMVGQLKRHISTFACVNTNPGNKSWYGEIGPLLTRNCKDTALHVGDLLNIVEGAAVIASLLEQHKESSSPPQNQLLMQNIVQDKLTYSFDIKNDWKNLKFVEYKSHLINGKGGALTQDIIVGGSTYSNTCVTVYENGAYVGILTYRKPADKEVHLKGTVSNEGILKVELFTGTKQNQQPMDFTWSSNNMKAKDKQEMTECVQSLLGDSEEKQLFEQTKKQLAELLDDIRPKLDTLQGIQKAIVTKSVEEAAAVVDHSTSTAVTMQNKIDQLVFLRSKYSI